MVAYFTLLCSNTVLVWLYLHTRHTCRRLSAGRAGWRSAGCMRAEPEGRGRVSLCGTIHEIENNASCACRLRRSSKTRDSALYGTQKMSLSISRLVRQSRKKQRTKTNKGHSDTKKKSLSTGGCISICATNVHFRTTLLRDPHTQPQPLPARVHHSCRWKGEGCVLIWPFRPSQRS